MITTIIFDLADVYLKGILGIEHYLEPILGIKAKEIYPMILGEELESLFRGEITEEEYWKKIIKKNNWNIDVKLFKKAIRNNFREIRGTREIIEKLREKGFKLGLLSVHAKEWIDYCNKKFDYHKLFYSILYSFEVGIRKPDKRIYELILERLKAKPNECVFIDDQERNLVPARELGMKTVCFEDSEQLKKELALFSVHID